MAVVIAVAEVILRISIVQISSDFKVIYSRFLVLLTLRYRVNTTLTPFQLIEIDILPSRVEKIHQARRWP